MKKQLLLGVLALSLLTPLSVRSRDAFIVADQDSDGAFTLGDLFKAAALNSAAAQGAFRNAASDQNPPTQKAGLADNTFSGDGAVEYTPSTDGVGIASLSDGSVVVVGSGSAERMICYDKLGSLVESFGTSGVGTFSTITDVLGVTTDANDNIYVLGKNGTNLRVEKYDRYGTAVSGFTVTALTSATSARGQVIYHDSALFVLGDNATNGYLYKLNATTGALDADFNSGAVLDLGVNFDINVGLAGSGSYVYALGYNSGSSTAAKIKKVAVSDGSLDSSYGTSGLAAVTITGASNSLKGLAVDSAGIAYVLGEDASDSKIGKVKADGSALDTDWATSGIYTISTHIGEDIMLDHNGNLVVAGMYTTSGNGTINKIIGDAADSNFGVSGAYTNTSATDGFNALVVTANNDYITTGGDSADTWTVKVTNGAAGTVAEQIAANAAGGGTGSVG